MTKKIINISLQRSATQSFHKFALKKGFLSKHYLSEEEQHFLEETNIKESASKYLDIVDDFEVVSDTPIALFLPDIYKKYPSAIFVMFVREPEEWAKSIKNHLAYIYSIEKKYSALDQLTYNKFLQKNKEIKSLTEDDFINIYKNYLLYARELAKKNKIFIFEIKLASKRISQDLNALFDSVRQSRYKEFPFHDHLAIWGPNAKAKKTKALPVSRKTE
jgi:hypothetical protein